jgi:uncharacterized protein YjiS (DUF1127 family)
MSTLSATVPGHRDGRLSTLVLRLLEFLHARITRHQAIREIEALSDHHLRDIGAQRHDIAALVDAGMNRIHVRRLGG